MRGEKAGERKRARVGDSEEARKESAKGVYVPVSERTRGKESESE
jgi:hypothetical protein